MKITRDEARSGRLDANHHSHTTSRSLAAWATRRAKALRIGVFDKRDSQYRVQSIQNGIVNGPRHSMSDETTYPGGILETRLADIESLALPILTNWCQGPPRALRNERQLVVFSAYLAVVHAQLPTISEQLREFDTASAEDEIRRVLGEDDIRIEMRPNEAARLSLHVPVVAFGAFRAMRWRLVEAPEGSEFITSDAPVNIFVPDEPSLGLDEGLMSPNAEATFPLSSRMCLIGRRARARSGAHSSGVREVNDRQARAAERFIYFREQTGAVEEAMKSAEKAVRPSPEYGLTHVGEFGALVIRGARPGPRRRMSG